VRAPLRQIGEEETDGRQKRATTTLLRGQELGSDTWGVLNLMIHANLSCHRVLARCRVLLPALLRSPRFPHIDISCAGQGPGLLVVGEAPVVPCCASPPGTYRHPCCRRRTGKLTGLGSLGTSGYTSSTSLQQYFVPPKPWICLWIVDSILNPRHPNPSQIEPRVCPKFCAFV